MAYIDKEMLNYLGQKVTTKLSTKVDKVEGKGLSSNDYTDAAVEEVAKVANKVDKVDGMGLSTNDYDNNAVAEVAKVKDKANALNPTFTGTVTVPTADDSSNGDVAASTAFVSNAVANAVNKITSFEYEIVAELPTIGSKGVIYLVPNNGAGNNMYDEHIWTESGTYELLGTKEMDLSEYLLASEVVEITNADIDAAFAD